MECQDSVVSSLTWFLIILGVIMLLNQIFKETKYGRYSFKTGYFCPARLAWFLQEVPAFLLPLLLLLLTEEEPGRTGDSTRDKTGDRTGDMIWRRLLLYAFMLHYFHKSIIYAFLTRGRPVPLLIVLLAAIFCSLNGF
ncbi:3-oxo-5-alpha-steroid 4-dehydrogenase 2-like, partial [Plectropomus leopardus]|uniref:3-oxo-5-alpha-steroid 4-dehydrogenase 2-like n=1 Tax=Plectropomus leopardus TaxID=160734 RepID=UPI001C4D8978